MRFLSITAASSPDHESRVGDSTGKFGPYFAPSLRTVYNQGAMQTANPSLPLEITAQSARETQALGRALGQAIVQNLVIALSGPLGAGKTTFTQGIAAGLGIEGAVTSPTFTLINEYESQTVSAKLLHVDTYRLGDATHEAVGMGFAEIMDAVTEHQGGEMRVLVVEWAERIAPLLPPDHLSIWLDYGDSEEQRVLTLRAHGPISAGVLTQLASYRSNPETFRP